MTTYHNHVKIDETLHLLELEVNAQVMRHLLTRIRGQSLEATWKAIAKVALEYGAYYIANSCTMVLFQQYRKTGTYDGGRA